MPTLDEFRAKYPALREVNDVEATQRIAAAYEVDPSLLMKEWGVENLYEVGDLQRSVRNYPGQTRQIFGAIQQLGGEGLRRAFGQGPVGEYLINAGQENIEKGQQSQYHKDTDSFTGAAEKGLGAVLTDYLPYMFGQGLGNLGEMALTGGVGSLVGKQALKYGAKEAINKQALSKASALGADIGLGAAAGFHGLGEVGGRAIEENGLENVDFTKVLPAAAGHAGLEYVGDKLMGNALKGVEKPRFTFAKDGRGAIPYNMGKEVVLLGAKEAPVEIAQTSLERAGSGLQLGNADAQKEYLNAGVGAFAQSGPAGVIGGARSSFRNETAKPEKPPFRQWTTHDALDDFAFTQSAPKEVLDGPDEGLLQWATAFDEKRRPAAQKFATDVLADDNAPAHIKQAAAKFLEDGDVSTFAKEMEANRRNERVSEVVDKAYTTVGKLAAKAKAKLAGSTKRSLMDVQGFEEDPEDSAFRIALFARDDMSDVAKRFDDEQQAKTAYFLRKYIESDFGGDEYVVPNEIVDLFGDKTAKVITSTMDSMRRDFGWKPTEQTAERLTTLASDVKAGMAARKKDEAIVSENLTTEAMNRVKTTELADIAAQVRDMALNPKAAESVGIQKLFGKNYDTVLQAFHNKYGKTQPKAIDHGKEVDALQAESLDTEQGNPDRSTDVKSMAPKVIPYAKTGYYDITDEAQLRHLADNQNKWGGRAEKPSNLFSSKEMAENGYDDSKHRFLVKDTKQAEEEDRLEVTPRDLSKLKDAGGSPRERHIGNGRFDIVDKDNKVLLSTSSQRLVEMVEKKTKGAAQEVSKDDSNTVDPQRKLRQFSAGLSSVLSTMPDGAQISYTTEAGERVTGKELPSDFTVFNYGGKKLKLSDVRAVDAKVRQKEKNPIGENDADRARLLLEKAQELRNAAEDTRDPEATLAFAKKLEDAAKTGGHQLNKMFRQLRGMDGEKTSPDEAFGSELDKFVNEANERLADTERLVDENGEPVQPKQRAEMMKSKDRLAVLREVVKDVRALIKKNGPTKILQNRLDKAMAEGKMISENLEKLEEWQRVPDADAEIDTHYRSMLKSPEESRKLTNAPVWALYKDDGDGNPTELVGTGSFDTVNYLAEKDGLVAVQTMVAGLDEVGAGGTTHTLATELNLQLPDEEARSVDSIWGKLQAAISAEVGTGINTSTATVSQILDLHNNPKLDIYDFATVDSHAVVGVRKLFNGIKSFLSSLGLPVGHTRFAVFVNNAAAHMVYVPYTDIIGVSVGALRTLEAQLNSAGTSNEKLDILIPLVHEVGHKFDYSLKVNGVDVNASSLNPKFDFKTGGEFVTTARQLLSNGFGGIFQYPFELYDQGKLSSTRAAGELFAQLFSLNKIHPEFINNHAPNISTFLAEVQNAKTDEAIRAAIAGRPSANFDAELAREYQRSRKGRVTTKAIYGSGATRDGIQSGGLSLPKPSKSNLGGKPLNDEKIAEIKGYVAKVLGPKIKVAFEKMKFAGEYDPVTGIKIATTAFDPMGTAHHEALHGFFNLLRTKGEARVVEALESLSNNKIIRRQLERLLSDHKGALSQLSDPEEFAAYAYQFWAAGKLNLGPKNVSFFEKVKNFIKEALGFVSQEKQAEMILAAFHQGQASTGDVSTFGAVMRSFDENNARFNDMLKKYDGVMQKLSSFFASVEGRLMESKNPALLSLAKDFVSPEGSVGNKQGFNQAKIQKKDQMHSALKRAIQKAYPEGEQVDPDDVQLALDAMQKGVLAKDPVARKIQDALQGQGGFFDKMFKYIDESGIKVWDAENKNWKDIGRVKRYFPRVWDSEVIGDRAQEFQDLLLAHHADELAKIGGKDVDPADVAKAITQRLLMNGGHAELSEGVSNLGFAPFMQAVNQRSLDFLDMKVFAEFQSKNFAQIMSSYINQTVNRGEYVKRFGLSGEKINQRMQQAEEWEAEQVFGAGSVEAAKKAAGKDEVWQEVLKKQDEDKFKQFSDIHLSHIKAVMALEGTLGHDVSEKMKSVQSYVNAYENVRLLIPSLFTNMIDPLGVIIRGGTLADAVDTMATGWKHAIRQWTDKELGEVEKEAEKLAEYVGTIDANHMLSLLGDMYNSGYQATGAKKINDTLFRWNGMEAFNRGIRASATVAAKKFIEKHVAEPNQHSRRYLDELYGEGQNPALNEDGTLNLKDDANRVALMRWVDGAILRPTAATRPTWGSDPRFQIFFHMKNYAYAMHRVTLQRAYKEFREGNSTPVLTLVVGYVPVMIAADLMKGMIMNLGDEPDWMKGMGPGEVLSNGIQRVGILGIRQFGLEALDDPIRVLGPVFGQLDDAVGDPAGLTAAKALPGQNVVRGIANGLDGEG